jgi:hypothetical protein
MPRLTSSAIRIFCGRKSLTILSLLFAGLTGLGAGRTVQGQTPASGDIVFSQIYARGGNPGSTYKDNYVELFNRSNNAADISGMPFHITSDTGAFTVAFVFTSSRGLVIPPGGYLLIEFESTGTSGGALPFPDLFVPQLPAPFGVSLSPSGKIAFSKTGTSLFGSCGLPNPNVIDFVGYGATANCFEGTGPTPTLSDTSAAIRKNGGCIDTNNNASDFVIGTPSPHNSFSAKHSCSAAPIDDPDFFIRQHYADFLNRQPDASGLAFWTNQITSCGTSQTCIDLRRINASAAFYLSIEFQETGYLVYRTYKAAYGNLTNPPNAPVPVTFQEFVPDTQQISQGVIVNSPGWEQILANNKAAFFLDFVSRLRFRNAFPNTMSPASFVDTLFMRAGVAPSAAERTAAINEFGSAGDTSDLAARARALRLVAENSTLAATERTRAFVLMQYFGYLRRNPYDAPESTRDFQGFNFWLGKLNQFNGDFVNAEMVKAFITSSEYRQRF